VCWPTTGSSVWRSRAAPAAVAIVLAVLGLIATAARLDGPSDGTFVMLGGSGWPSGGVAVHLSGAGQGLRDGDVVVQVGGDRLSDGLGKVPQPPLGSMVGYAVIRDGAVAWVPVRVERPDPSPLLDQGWGDLVFVFALAGLAVALYWRRPEEPATAALLVLAAGLWGSTLTVVARLPGQDDGIKSGQLAGDVAVAVAGLGSLPRH